MLTLVQMYTLMTSHFEGLHGCKGVPGLVSCTGMNFTLGVECSGVLLGSGSKALGSFHSFGWKRCGRRGGFLCWQPQFNRLLLGSLSWGRWGIRKKSRLCKSKLPCGGTRELVNICTSQGLNFSSKRWCLPRLHCKWGPDGFARSVKTQKNIRRRISKYMIKAIDYLFKNPFF